MGSRALKRVQLNCRRSAAIISSSGDRIGIPFVKAAAALRRSNDPPFEQGKFLAYEGGCRYFGVRSRGNAGYSSGMHFPCDRLAPWRGHTIREIVGETKLRQPLRSAGVESSGHRNVERDEFWAGFGQQIKKLDRSSRVLCTRIGRSNLDRRVQIERTNFPRWIPAAAMLLRVRRVCRIGPLGRDYSIVEATTENCTIRSHSRTAVVKQPSEIRVNWIYSVCAQRLQNGAVA